MYYLLTKLNNRFHKYVVLCYNDYLSHVSSILEHVIVSYVSINLLSTDV